MKITEIPQHVFDIDLDRRIINGIKYWIAADGEHAAYRWGGSCHAHVHFLEEDGKIKKDLRAVLKNQYDLYPAHEILI